MTRFVEFTCEDNFYANGGSGPPGGGDRVGLGEIAFEDRVPNPNPIIDVAGGVDFGSFESPPGAVTAALTVRNLGGDQALRISSVTLQPGTPGAEHFSVSADPLTVPAGQDAALALTLDAGDNEGCFHAQLELATNDPDRPRVNVLLVAAVNCVPPELDEPIFSVDSGTFVGSFQLALSTPTAGGVVVFTTDGTMPSAQNGTIYAEPITIDRSIQVRAATIFGDQPPATATENYVRLATDVQAYSSALPIMIVENYGAGSIPNKGLVDQHPDRCRFATTATPASVSADHRSRFRHGHRDHQRRPRPDLAHRHPRARCLFIHLEPETVFGRDVEKRRR